MAVERMAGDDLGQCNKDTVVAIMTQFNFFGRRAARGESGGDVMPQMTGVLPLIVTRLLGETLPEAAVAVGCVACNFFLAWGVFMSAARAVEAYKKMLRRSRCLCALLDFRSARRAGIPHLPINNVGQAQSWLFLRGEVKTRAGGVAASRTVDYIVSGSFFYVACLFLYFVVSQTKRTAADQALSAFDWQCVVMAFFVGVHVISIVHMGSVINAILHDQVVLMNEQLKLCMRAHQDPSCKEACDRTIKFLDVVRFCQKDANSPLQVLRFPINDTTLFRIAPHKYLKPQIVSAGGSVRECGGEGLRGQELLARQGPDRHL